MRDLVVVVGNPSLCLLAHFGEIAEDVHVEHAAPEAAIESFDETVLHRPAWLDEVQRGAFAFRPLGQRQRYEKLRSVVQAQLGGVAAPGGDAFQRASDARGRQVEIDLDRQRFSAESSMTLKVRKRRPSHKASDMKSIDQLALTCSPARAVTDAAWAPASCRDGGD